MLSIALAGLLPAYKNTVASTPSPEYVFIKDFIESLRYQKAALTKQLRITPPRPGKKQDAQNISAFLKDITLASADLKQAHELISRHRDSGNEAIKKIANSLLSVYAKQIRHNERSIKLYTQAYSPDVVNKLDDFSEGKLMEEVHKIPKERENLNKLLADSSILVTHLLYSNRPDQNGKLSYLSISSKERESLLQQIREVFPEGEAYLAACADQIRQVLESRYKSADEN